MSLLVNTRSSSSSSLTAQLEGLHGSMPSVSSLTDGFQASQTNSTISKTYTLDR
uniref:Uncharacterized protein n=1 Tax=Arundo donax TaxID=35708 RepID=A0A0A9AMN5_ARUDO